MDNESYFEQWNELLKKLYIILDENNITPKIFDCLSVLHLRSRLNIIEDEEQRNDLLDLIKFIKSEKVENDK